MIIQQQLDPRDIRRALIQWSEGWVLSATFCGRSMSVTNISVEKNAYELEHWEKLWVRAEDITSLQAFKSHAMRPILPCESWEEVAENIVKPYRGPNNDLA